VCIRDSITSDDREALKAAGHCLAGTSLSAGAMRIGMLARTLEGAASQATQLRLRDLASEIVSTLDLTTNEIRRFTATIHEPVA